MSKELKDMIVNAAVTLGNAFAEMIKAVTRELRSKNKQEAAIKK
jgi:hypothetical protein